MNREARLQSARHWLKKFSGRDFVRGYRKWYGVSTVCAILELRRLGVAVPEERFKQALQTELGRARERAVRRAERLSDQFPESDETNDFICHYTGNELPFLAGWEDQEESTGDESEDPGPW